MTDTDLHPERPKRLTLSEIVTALLQRGGGDRSSVSLTRNAKGQTQIDVTVRTGHQEDVETAEQAMTKATELYNTLRFLYPIDGDEVPAVPMKDSEAEAAVRLSAERWAAGEPEPSDDPKLLGAWVLGLLDARKAGT
jgi:hypothetical protein